MDLYDITQISEPVFLHLSNEFFFDGDSPSFIGFVTRRHARLGGFSQHHRGCKCGCLGGESGVAKSANGKPESATPTQSIVPIS